MLATSLLFCLATAPDAVTRMMNSMFDNTFADIHQMEFFDWAMLVPYFVVLIVLSVYGLHRCEMIRGYVKHRKNLLKQPPSRFAALPRVTLQLPLYNERYVVERLLEGTVKIDYPPELLQIQVLDDSTDETHAFT
ncbi:MAG: glycosyl transferase family 2, partial [Bryobacteraceae bacterium]